MPISSRGAGTVVLATTGPGSITLNATSTVVATDIIVAGLLDNSGTSFTPTAPSGWTQIGSRVTAGATVNAGVSMWWALGNVASFTFTVSGANEDYLGATVAYIGVDNVTPMDVTGAGQTNAASTTVVAPSLTTVTANAWLVGFFGALALSTPTGSGWSGFGTDRVNGNGVGAQSNLTLDFEDAAQAAAGPSGTKSATFTLSGGNTLQNIGFLVALRPAGVAFAPDEDLPPMLQVQGDRSVLTVFRAIRNPLAGFLNRALKAWA